MPTQQQLDKINWLVYKMIEKEEESEDELPDRIGNALSYESVWKDTIVKQMDRRIGRRNCNLVLSVADHPHFYLSNHIEDVVSHYLDYPTFD